ncbi:MAG: hypothetical protein A2W61_01195 [Deltaproteobacteria bacterium RIFCSPLOWO2_01_44_7]|nr:MAG: hypothetical protein A2712_00635 [Deltaproteobacteria bacterium RIFCSPHIGHO2_01_FULL_43_49]OGQ14219.1 MAG: hypothetical protein A3D22_09980 [Deltaproteobacteria bacterium RIFCSPHIGHO2_02_FULL_44_53]OGQ27435.1 MAG: hypothetical protein A3D98_03580 [Deltaproteobacteria bacterium RIFCSPHIGHO2_12_FULL_44_21]OGQ30683.1 MAG: hypothetical protein A2979_06005 [Deltaproteobacteria bacterium RIFCSPLOWO2_01_FULL_45_74]OGQ37728.1 MAG: hypothetical protein A2W61_01195 [Deltaproteobacteria bacterium 
MKPKISFGEFFKQKRIGLGVTLRQFCQQNGFDAGNISKLERDVFAAPQSEEKLEEYANALKLERGSADWIEFFDLAAVSSRNLDLMKIKNEDLIQRLPVLFRTLDNKELTEEKLDQIIELIKRA